MTRSMRSVTCSGCPTVIQVPRAITTAFCVTCAEKAATMTYELIPANNPVVSKVLQLLDICLTDEEAFVLFNHIDRSNENELNAGIAMIAKRRMPEAFYRNGEYANELR